MLNNRFINSKTNHYLTQAIEADKAGDKASRLQNARMLVVLTRMETRTSINKMLEQLERLTDAKRSMTKANEQGVYFPYGEHKISQMELHFKNLKELVASSGGMMCAALDVWQIAGATLHDLCNLCNRDYQKILEEIPPEHHNDSFKDLIFVYNLDYKDPRRRGWIDYDVDAPLTHSIKEHYLELMMSTPEARTASNVALQECFPDIWENRLFMYTDADGNEHMIDKDGVDILTD